MPLDTLKAKRRRLWREHLFDARGSETEDRQVARLAMVEGWSKNPWDYLNGRDLPDPERDHEWMVLLPEWQQEKLRGGGKPIMWTVDERDDDFPVKPFPALVEPENYAYLRDLIQELFGKYRIVFLDKARQIYATTICCAALDWYCSFTDEREVLVSRVKEASAVKLINDRIRTPHSRKPRWLRDLIAMTEMPARVVTYGNTGSTVTGVAQNVATSDARGLTGSIIMADEAAYQQDFPALYRAVLPMTGRLWAITTANIGNPGAKVFRDLIMEGRPNRGLEEEHEVGGEVQEDPGATQEGSGEDPDDRGATGLGVDPPTELV